MKKLILVLLGLLYALSGFSQGQNGSIRAAVYAPADNTGRAINYVQIATPSTATSTDTVFLSPYGGYNYIQPSDSVLEKVVYVIQTKPVNYAGDKMTFLLALSKKKLHDTIQFRNKYNTSFKFSKAADSTFVIVGGKSYYSDWIFNGTYWQEIVTDSINR